MLGKNSVVLAPNRTNTQSGRTDMTDIISMTDPVCKMPLRADQVRETVVVEGQVYCFCSIGCRAEFQRHPEDYLRRLPKEAGLPHV